jgi:hypothetical protein
MGSLDWSSVEPVLRITTVSSAPGRCAHGRVVLVWNGVWVDGVKGV